MNLKICLAYLDDIIVFAKSFTEMLDRLEAVLCRLSKYGLKLKPSKCKLFQMQLTYLGHVVSREGVGPDPDKLAALQEWLEHPPKNTKELQTFLGFAGYYRSFVAGFTSIASLLHCLTGQSKTTGTNNKPRPTFQWTDACQAAFETLINKLSSAPTLTFPDFTLPFVLHTDASGDGLGAALYQVHDGKACIIAYGSRALQPSEKRYSAYRREFLALKWAVTEKFQLYLYGQKFQIVPDSNPLTYLLTTSNDPTNGQQQEEADPLVFVIASGESKNNSDLNAAAPHSLPVQPIGPPDVVDVGPHQHPDVTVSGESEGDLEDPDTASMASDDPAGLHDQISDPEDQAADISPPASDIGAGDPTDSDSQANQPALERPVVTRSGRATKPPERLVCDPTWCNKATILLSFSSKSHLA